MKYENGLNSSFNNLRTNQIWVISLSTQCLLCRRDELGTMDIINIKPDSHSTQMQLETNREWYSYVGPQGKRQSGGVMIAICNGTWHWKEEKRSNRSRATSRSSNEEGNSLYITYVWKIKEERRKINHYWKKRKECAWIMGRWTHQQLDVKA